jgi:hypothetical protein
VKKVIATIVALSLIIMLGIGLVNGKAEKEIQIAQNAPGGGGGGGS